MHRNVKARLAIDLRRIIEEDDASMSDICRATGIEPATMSRFVRKQRNLSLEAIDALMRHYNLELTPRKDRKQKCE